MDKNISRLATRTRGRYILRLLCVVVAVTFVMSLVGGCSYRLGQIGGYLSGSGYSTEFKTDGMRLNGTKVDLSQVLAIVPLEEPSSKGELPKDRSQVAFIYRDGSYKVQDNSYTGGKAVAWTKKGVFYSDRKYDYFIDAQTNILRVTKHEKNENQYGTYALDDDHAMTQLADNTISVAASDGSYVETKAKVSSNDFLGDSVTVCSGGNSYQVVSDSLDEQLEMTQLSDHNKPMFKKIYTVKALKAKDFSDPKVVMKHTKNKPYVEVDNGYMPCVNNTIYSMAHISEQNSQEEEPTYMLTLMKWNVETGKYSFTVLRDTTGKILYAKAGSEWNSSEISANSVKDNKIIFTSEDSGAIVQADVNSGVATTVVKALADYRHWPVDSVVDTSDKYIYQKQISSYGVDAPCINVYSRDTFKRMKQIKIDNKILSEEQKSLGIAGEAALNPKIDSLIG